MSSAPARVAACRVKPSSEAPGGLPNARPRLRPAFHGALSMLARVLRVEIVHRLDEDARQHPEQRAVVREPAAPRKRKSQHPLSQGDLRQYELDQIRCRFAHVSPQTRWAEA